MTLQDIQRRNQHFQKRAVAAVDMVPGGAMLDVCTALIRSVRLIDKYLIRLLQAKNESQFVRIMSSIEEELDESVFLLDRIDHKNRTLKMNSLENFLKEGYDLLSIYSLCCDQLIGKKLKGDEEIL